MKKTAFESEKLTNKMIKVSIEIIKDRVGEAQTNRLNVAKLAQSCEVSRAWIYKNFGANHDQIILTAIDILAPTLTASIRPMDIWRTPTASQWMIEFMKSMELTLEQVEADPAIFKFYIINRLQPTTIGQHLAHHEKRFINHTVRRQVEISGGQADLSQTTAMAEYLAAIRTGLIFKWLSAPQITLSEKKKELQGVGYFLSQLKAFK